MTLETQEKITVALNACAALIKYQFTASQESMAALQNASEECYEALAAVRELQEQEPVAYAIYSVHESTPYSACLLNDDWKTDNGGLGEYWGGNEPLYAAPLVKQDDTALLQQLQELCERIWKSKKLWSLEEIQEMDFALRKRLGVV